MKGSSEGPVDSSPDRAPASPRRPKGAKSSHEATAAEIKDALTPRGALTYEPMAGENVKDTARAIAAMASENNARVTAKFNDVELTANPGDDAAAIAKSYMDEVQRRHDEYVNSPKYKEDQRKQEEAQRNREALLTGALMGAPEKMSVRDEAAWKEMVAKNTDGYGAATLRYAETWARLMEGRIANGDTVAGCAEEASQIADVEGITGAMYGFAVGTLTRVWAHGEELAAWRKAQRGG